MKPDRYLWVLFVLGLCFLAFVAGSSVLYFKLPPHRLLSDSFNAAQTWLGRWEEIKDEAIPQQAGITPTGLNKTNESILRAAKVRINEPAAYQGYTLISTGFMNSAFLVDMEGKIVHRWDLPFSKAWPQPTHINAATRAPTYINFAHVFPNGDLIAQYCALGDSPYGYGIAKMDKNSNILWTYSGNSHHDFYMDKEDGDIYTLTHQFIDEAPKGLEALTFPMLTDNVVRLSSEGKELERIPILDAFLGTPYELLLYHDKNDGIAYWDHMHTNSVEKLEPNMASKFPMFKAGQILVSIRGFNAIAVIDPTTRKVIWAYTGPWKLQHAAHFLPNGNILVYDNMGHVESGRVFSRIIEFNPQTLGIQWYFAGSKEWPFHSNIIGRSQRLPNGNTLIAESMHQHIFEVTQNGDIVWDYHYQPIRRPNPVMNALYTATRYSAVELPFLKP